MSEVDKKIFGQELVEHAHRFMANLNGDLPQLKKDKARALEFLKKNGFPGPHAEEYKFTRLTQMITQQFDLSESVTPITSSDEKIAEIKAKHQGANLLFFINGKYDTEKSDIVSPKEALSIQPLKGDRESHHDQPTAEDQDPFAAQNSIYAREGMVIEVKSGHSVAAPIISYYISVDEEHPHHAFIKNTYCAHENSQASFVQFHIATGEARSFTNECQDYVVKQNAQVCLYKIQTESSGALYVGNTRVHQARDSQFSSYIFTLEGQMVRNNLHITVGGEGCQTDMYGLYLTTGQTHVDNHTTVDHQQPHCESRELYKGMIGGESTGVFNGKIFVRKPAQKTNAFQSNTNVLLSNQATVHAKPQLEIWADDVKCSHGCTTGQLDEEMIFYLRTRGISQAEAQSMILLANASEVLEKIKLGWLKVEMTDKIIRRLV